MAPGRRDLAARLTLDPLIEAEHLPPSVKVTFTGTAGTTSLDGGRIPSAGTVTVTLSNATSQPADLPTAADASATEQHGLQQLDVLVDQVGLDELRRKGSASPDLEGAFLGGPQLADRTDARSRRRGPPPRHRAPVRRRPGS